MKELISVKDPEVIQACVVMDSKNELAYCVYHSDDGQAQLIFTKNLTDLHLMEDFTGTELDEVITHLNTYGFCIESGEEFGDMDTYECVPNDFSVKIVEAELTTSTKVVVKV